MPFNPSILDKTFEDLGAELSTRIQNALKDDNIRTVRQLVHKTRVEMLRAPNIAHQSVNEIEEWLKGHGLRLGMKDDLLAVPEGSVSYEVCQSFSLEEMATAFANSILAEQDAMFTVPVSDMVGLVSGTIMVSVSLRSLLDGGVEIKVHHGDQRLDGRMSYDIQNKRGAVVVYMTPRTPPAS